MLGGEGCRESRGEMGAVQSLTRHCDNVCAVESILLRQILWQLLRTSCSHRKQRSVLQKPGTKFQWRRFILPGGQGGLTPQSVLAGAAVVRVVARVVHRLTGCSNYAATYYRLGAVGAAGCCCRIRPTKACRPSSNSQSSPCA